MKKLLSIFFVFAFLYANAPVFAVTSTANNVSAPIWEDYVPKKYQNPRSFPNKGKNIAELSVGIFLTDLLITAPVGIPMICHASTKMKNQSYYTKKIKFEKGLKEAEKIQNPQEKKAYYENLLKACKLTPQKKNKKS